MGSLYLITGTDEFAVKNEAKKIIVSICGEPLEESPVLEIIKGDSDEMKPDEVLFAAIASIQTPPFFEPTKVIWLRHALGLEKQVGGTVKSRAGKPIEKLTDLIKDGLPDEVSLIIDAPGIKKNTVLYKACDKSGECRSYDKVELNDKNYAQNQRQKIQAICREHNVKIMPEAVDFLMESSGSDTGRLQNELDKVVCYIGGQDSITLDDCKVICSHTPEALSWAFADALVEGNATKALKTVNTLIEQMRAEKGSGNMELRILNNAVSRFQQMVQIKSIIKSLNFPNTRQYNTFKGFLESISEDVKSSYGKNPILTGHPYRAFMLYSDAVSVSDAKLVRAMSALLEANKALVSGGGESRIVLEQLVLNVIA